MEKAIVAAVALHALLAFIPIGDTDAPSQTPDPVVRLRVRATAPSPASVTAPPPVAPATAPVPRPDAPTTTAPATRTKTAHRRAVTPVETQSPTVTRTADQDRPVAPPSTAAADPDIPSIAATASTLGTLGETPPPPPRRFAAENYARTVRSMMAKQKRYPPRAERQGVEGVVVVSVTIDARGGLAAPPRVRRSSGSDDLDREGLRMARRAAPFPAPAGARAHVAIDVPVRFSLDSGRR